jgi:hypothetical protein
VTWRVRFSILLLTAVPAFTGWPLGFWEAWILPGVRWSPVVYLVAMHLVLLPLAGTARYQTSLAIAATVTLPVVFVGAGLSWLLAFFGISDPRDVHYVRLCITMLTVVPLALVLVAVLPLADFEQRLLQSPRGVGRMGRRALMALRVFNHIVHFVIPTVLEVVREEGLLRPQDRRPGGLVGGFVQIAVAGICGALQYIPLWAREIARLPEPPP